MSRSTKITIAFLIVCLAWGASYLCIRIGLEAFPPFLLGGVRYGTAGLLMWIWCDIKGDARPTAKQWLSGLILGLCFVTIGNGLVTWSEQSVPSGITALLIAVAPAGTLLLEWAMRQRSRPGPLTWLGLVLGLIGVIVLVVRPGQNSFPLWPTLLILISTVGWSLGSNLALKLDRPSSPIRAISSQMIIGSVVFFLLSAVRGESRSFHLHDVTLQATGALLYLVFVASIAAYIAYGFLIDNVSPTAAGTCSYVNPVVAMLLGACFGEPIGLREFASLAIVLTGVALVSSQELLRSKDPLPIEECPEPMVPVQVLVGTSS